MNYNSQLKAWAIDRAIETLKIAGTMDGENVINLAQKYVEYAADAEPEAEPVTEQ